MALENFRNWALISVFFHLFNCNLSRLKKELRKSNVCINHSCSFSASGDVTEDIRISEAVSWVDTQITNLEGLPISLENDLVFVSQDETTANFDWGETEQVTTNFHGRFHIYSKSTILALSHTHRFEAFCQSQYPTQCLQYLMEEIDPSSPDFRDYLRTASTSYLFNTVL